VPSKTAQSSKQHETTPLLEWILGGLGVALFAWAVGFLVLEGWRGHDRPGGVEIRVEEIVPTDDAYIVRYEAQNEGTQTLVDVHISAVVLDATSEIERAEAVIDFLPGQSLRRGGFYLREDPRKYQLEIRVEGYQEP
jgi:uncharacterized protein (TIGR02588 family)